MPENDNDNWSKLLSDFGMEDAPEPQEADVDFIEEESESSAQVEDEPSGFSPDSNEAVEADETPIAPADSVAEQRPAQAGRKPDRPAVPSQHWDSLVGELGLEVPPAAEPVRTEAPSEPDTPEKEISHPKSVLDSMFVPHDADEDRLDMFSKEKSSDDSLPGFGARVEEAESPEEEDASSSSGFTSDAETGEESIEVVVEELNDPDSEGRPRRRRRRSRRRRETTIEDPGRQSTQPAGTNGISKTDSEVEVGDTTAREQEEAGFSDANAESEGADAESEGTGRKRKRRSRRRGRGRGSDSAASKSTPDDSERSEKKSRSRSDAGESSFGGDLLSDDLDDDDLDDDDLLDDDLRDDDLRVDDLGDDDLGDEQSQRDDLPDEKADTQSRSGGRNRPRRSRSSNETGGEGSSGDASRRRKRFRSIPSWVETISHIVDANIERHKKEGSGRRSGGGSSSSGGGGSRRSRGSRGGRGRGGSSGGSGSSGGGGRGRRPS